MLGVAGEHRHARLRAMSAGSKEARCFRVRGTQILHGEDNMTRKLIVDCGQCAHTSAGLPGVPWSDNRREAWHIGCLVC